MIKLPWLPLSIISILFGIGFLLMGAAFTEPCKILQKGSDSINPFHSYSKGISCAFSLNFAGGSILTALGIAFGVIWIMERYIKKKQIS